MSSCTIDAPGRSRGVPPEQRAHRDSIFVEDGKLLSQQEYPGKQFVIRIQAPKCAAAAVPGSFAHLTCDPERPMRRPLSLMRVDAKAGWIEILYKIVGPGLEALSQQPAGRDDQRARPDRPRFRRASRATADAARGRRRRHPADGVPGGIAEGPP